LLIPVETGMAKIRSDRENAKEEKSTIYYRQGLILRPKKSFKYMNIKTQDSWL
jgi:hypothetical protein